MNYETINIEKVEESCQLCEDYAEKHSTNPPKIAVMACDGACARGEVARIAANLVAHKLARENTVRICLGGAFTKDTGQRNLVRRANKTIAIEGCFISCSSRMMKGVLPGIQPEIVQADTLYESFLPFGVDEVSEEELRKCANIVAKTVTKEHIKNWMTFPHIKLIRGVFIFSNENAEKVILFLKEFNAEYYVRDVILLPEDEDMLKQSQT